MENNGKLKQPKKTQLPKQWWPEPTRGVPEIGVPPNHPFLETPTRIQALRPRRMRIEQIVVSSQPLANGLAPCAKISAKSWIPKVPSIGFSQFGAQFGVPLKVGNANDVTPCDAILNVVILCDTDHKPLAFQCPTARLHGVAIDPRHGFHVGESGGRFTLGTLAKLGGNQWDHHHHHHHDHTQS